MSKQDKDDELDDNDLSGEGLRLKVLLEENRIAKTNFANKLNIHRATLHTWFKQHRIPIENLIRIQKNMDEDISTVFPRLLKHKEITKNHIENSPPKKNAVPANVVLTGTEFQHFQNLKEKVALLEKMLADKEVIIKSLNDQIELLRSK